MMSRASSPRKIKRSGQKEPDRETVIELTSHGEDLSSSKPLNENSIPSIGEESEGSLEKIKIKSPTKKGKTV